ncbi:unnamed protein product [Linum trigynum]|uniref:Uncharacterized protein n=1 Tax=Linum trigynum TaxID=586398 RepID=A0AAV2DXX3_9ROSI
MGGMVLDLTGIHALALRRLARRPRQLMEACGDINQTAALCRDWEHPLKRLEPNHNHVTITGGKQSDVDVACIDANEIRVAEDIKNPVNEIVGKETMRMGEQDLGEVFSGEKNCVELKLIAL